MACDKCSKLSEMEHQTVSILMPTFNPDPAFLQAAVGSVLNQSYPHWTLFIHDDASGIDVRALVEPFLRDERIRFARSEERLGIAGNWNACLAQARGEFVQFLFQDDLWYREYLEKNVHIFRESASVGLVSSFHTYKAEGEDAQTFLVEGGFERVQEERRKRMQAGNGKAFLMKWAEEGLWPNLIGEPSFVMLRRSLTDCVGIFREKMPQGLDLEYWVRCLLLTDIEVLREELGIFRVHAGGASMRNDRNGSGLFDRLRCFSTLIALLPRGEERKKVKRALLSQIDLLAQKFRGRIDGKRGVGGAGASEALHFFLRHPRLLIRALIAAMFAKK